MKKQLILRIHGMASSPKFGFEQFDRDDPYIAQKRAETGMESGRLLETVTPCRTDLLVNELADRDMILTNVVQIMAGPRKTTPILYLTYSNEGGLFLPKLSCADHEWAEVSRKFEFWEKNILNRSWDSGQIYQNTDSVSVCVVGSLKLNVSHAPLSMSDVLVQIEQQSASA